MVTLDNFENQITTFIESSIENFTSTHGTPSSVGIYCCPWAGWLTTNFNISQTMEESFDNCPDFEFVEFDVLDLSIWQDEYETDEPTFKISGTIVKHDHNLGDEKLNELVFKFLEPIALTIKQRIDATVLLQMLDSAFVKVL